MNEQINQRQNNNILQIIIIILLVVLIAIGGMILLKDNKKDNSGTDNNISQNENVLQNNETTANNYKNYYDNLQKNREQKIISGIDNIGTPFEKIGIESIVITEDGVAKVLGNATGNKEINGILTAFVFPIGNAGFRTVVFIKEDGTLLAMDANKLTNEKKIEYITNFGSIKDVVLLDSFNNLDKDPTGGGVASVRAIDINGNAYDIGQYLLGSSY